MTGGLGVDMNPRNAARMMQNPSGIAEMLTQEDPQTGDSPAEIFADIITVLRADTRKLAEQHDVDVDVEVMSPDRAAELLAGTVAGDGIEIVVMFNQIAEKRDQILREALDDDEYERFMAQKKGAMHTSDPEGFDG